MVRLAEFVLRAPPARRGLLGRRCCPSAVIAAGQTSKRLVVDFSLPGQPGYETEKQLLATRSTTAGPTRRPSRSSPCPRARPSRTSWTRSPRCSTRSRRRCPAPGWSTTPRRRTRCSSPRTGARRTRWSTPSRSRASPTSGPDVAMRPILEKASADTGFDFGVTGYNLLAQGTEDPEAPSLLVETLLGGLGALAVLLFLFASFLALVPLLIAAVSILTTFTIVLLGTYVTDISFVVQFLIALVGLGVAVDYSLLVVNRWREERAHGRDNHDAVVVAMQYAGHAVVASAGTVAISLCALLVIPVPLLRSMGIGGMLIPLVSTRGHPDPPAGPAGQHRPEGRLATDPARGQGVPGLDGLGPADRAVALGRRRRRPGDPRRADHPDLRHQDRPGADRLAGQRRPGLRAAPDPARRRRARAASCRRWRCWSRAPTRRGSADAGGRRGPRRRRRGGGLRPGQRRSGAPTAPRSSASSRRRRRSTPRRRTSSTTCRRAIDDVPGVVGIAGVGPTVLDYINAVYKKFPYSLGLIALVTFILLVRTFRSILLPVKAVLLNIVSVGRDVRRDRAVLAGGPRLAGRSSASPRPGR